MERTSDDTASVTAYFLNNSVPLVSRRPVQLAFAAFAIGFIALAIAGGIRTFCAVPYYDMFNGGLEFFMRVTDGDRSAWWAQHNEHRILLARALFWLDYRYFGGTSEFLIAVNYLLALVGLVTFWRIMRDMAGTARADAAEWIVASMMAAWLFQWMQGENFTWAFQSQFFLAQLLPLCALYLLARAVPERGFSPSFTAACVLGIGSACTMANGVLALPLMVLFAVATRQSITRVSILAMLSAVMLYLYFHDYVSPAYHGSLRLALTETPRGLIHYVLLYVGSPFHFLLGEGNTGRIAATIAGLLFVLLSLLVALRILPMREKAPIALALLTFILYTGGTAIGTAGGRLIFGLNQALSQRYTTPALMAWLALALIGIRPLLHAIRNHGGRTLPLLCGLGALMALGQQRAVIAAENDVHEREVAGLALELGVRDSERIAHIFPAPDIALAIADKAHARHLGIFGTAPLRGLRADLGMPLATSDKPLQTCQGSLETVKSLDGDKQFLRVSGWLFDSHLGRSPAYIQFIDAADRVIGIALPGKPRPDIAASAGGSALPSGFNGYILQRSVGEPIRIRSAAGNCEMNATIPRNPASAATGGAGDISDIQQ